MHHISQNQLMPYMSKMDSSYQSDDSSDSEDETLKRTQRADRVLQVRNSNLFFSTTNNDDKDAIRSSLIYKRNHYEKGLTKDKRSTVQQVLDKRTYIRLRKLCGKGVFHYMHGVISTGKEASVFEGETLPNSTTQSQSGHFAGKLIVTENAKDIEDATRAFNTVTVSTATHQSQSETTEDVEDCECDQNDILQANHARSDSADQKTIYNLDACRNDNGTRTYGSSRVAIKVYKTSILVFKDRSRYIEGEFRFRRAYVGTKNPRKMVTQWAEKEFRNLRRIALSGLYSPAPIALKDHVLVMDFILNKNNVAPKLEHLGALQLVEWQTIYAQTIGIMRVLFQECKLIHGDLSSFNMLYSDGRVYVIDTSQALENDHINAMPFLKRDCENVTKFFETVNIIQHQRNDELNEYDTLKILNAQQLFCFVIARNLGISDSNQNANDQEKKDGVPRILWEDETLTHVKNFWNMQHQTIIQQVEDCVSKMTKFNHFGAVKDLTALVTKKRMAYLALCKTVYNFLTGPVFANETCWKQITWLKEMDFDKQLPLNMSQIPLELAESALEHSKNVIIALNALSEGSASESDNEELNLSKEESHGHEKAMDKDRESPKFTGRIPEGIDPREWKKMVKEHNREKRKHKVPKHIKKKYGASKA